MSMKITAENYGAETSVSGRLKIVHSFKELHRVQKDDIVFFTLRCDLLSYVVRAIDMGAVGFISSWGRTNHGVIAAKELSVPAYCARLDQLIEGQTYSLSEGAIYLGKKKILHRKKRLSRIYKTKKKIFMNLGFPKRTLQKNTSIARLVDGVGFARIEFVILDIVGNKHPITYLCKNGPEEFFQQMYHHFSFALRHFSGRSFWIRTDDFSPNQLVELEGGEKYEVETADELVSFRGIARAIDKTWLNLGNFEKSLKGISWIGLQFKAIKMLAQKFPNVKLGVFAPMVHDVSEYRKWQKLAVDELGGATKYGVMVETPALCDRGILPFLKEKLISFAIFGTNDLTALTLGINRSDSRFHYLFDEENPMVLQLMEKTIYRCKEKGVMTAIGGAAASKKTLMAKLYRAGIDAFSVAPNVDTVRNARKALRQLEKS